MKTDTRDPNPTTPAATDATDAIGAADRQAILTRAGSWLTDARLIELPYDFETGGRPFPTRMPRALDTLRNVSSAARRPFILPAQNLDVVHLISAMGVVLGDSIIGLTALDWLRRTHPSLELVLYRPASSPDYVEQLYRLAKSIGLGTLRDLPWPAASIAKEERIVDIGNIVFWPSFATTPMIDFFLQAIGVDAAQVPPHAKANRWLAELALPALPAPWRDAPYVLFSPDASSRVRTIPAAVHAAWIDRLWDAYGLPVLGFTPIDHPRYTSIRSHAPDTPAFLSWIRHARALVTADSAAVHAAAGFDVPTTAIFTTIDPTLRVRDYPHCTAVDFRIEGLYGVHSSEAPDDVELVARAWRDAALDAMPLPEPRPALRGAAGSRESHDDAREHLKTVAN
ncbi:ADP-heptose--LPS heptosyltransferase [Pararobbsia silviterrae]|uniref:ADP-heptose--LPS heptosyltransferase n=1 Tax=Pararobbsia silviterrae TaxID=1792498 RepID=A0A494YD51_9BURK|nr:ADP-heptose--LPS heptosyltransferase [Pararobbsia silviterrae]RKP58648.1 ADP-heptose--LPS heptosyltransferase [Pararobbsia silviterrae]